MTISDVHIIERAGIHTVIQQSGQADHGSCNPEIAYKGNGRKNPGYGREAQWCGGEAKTPRAKHSFSCRYLPGVTM